MKENEYPKGATNKEAAVDALRTLEQNRTGIILTGVVKNGKVVIDQRSLDEVARKFPNAEISFVADNAPFDPHAQAPGDAAQ
jgi:hypothetical protein